MMTMKWMTGWMLGACACFAVMTAAAQTSSPTKDDLFAGTEIFAKGASDVNEVTMDPDTLDMVGGPNSKAAHSMVLNVVRSYSYDKPGMYRIEDVDAFRNKLNTGDWHCSVHTRDLKNGESTDICNKRRSDGFVETAIITVEPKELTFIHTIRKRGEGEHSEWNDSMILPRMPGLPMVAMLKANVLPAMDLALANVNNIDFTEMQAKMQAEMQAHALINSAEMKERMAEAQEMLQDQQKKWKNEGESRRHHDLDAPGESEKPKDRQPE